MQGHILSYVDCISNLNSLEKAEILITDNSSIVFEFLLTFKRPVIYLDYTDKIHNVDRDKIQIPTIDVGNTAHNVIPEYAQATVNIRFNDLHTSESLINWLQTHINQIFNGKNNAECSFTFETSAKSFLNKYTNNGF